MAEENYYQEEHYYNTTFTLKTKKCGEDANVIKCLGLLRYNHLLSLDMGVVFCYKDRADQTVTHSVKGKVTGLVAESTFKENLSASHPRVLIALEDEVMGTDFDALKKSCGLQPGKK